MSLHKSLARWVLRDELVEERAARLAAERTVAELRDLTAAPDPAPRPQPAMSATIAGNLGLLTFAATLVFGLIWMSYRRAYGTLGLTPDEVGLDYSGILSRASTGFGVLGLSVVIGWGIWHLFGRLADSDEISVDGTRKILGLAMCGSLLIVVYFLLSGQGLPIRYVGYLFALTVIELACFFVLVTGVGSRAWFQKVDRSISRVAAWWQVPVAIVMLLLLLNMPNMAGATMSKSIESGGFIPSRLFPALVDAKVVSVDVHWLADSKPDFIDQSMFPHGFYYLGQRGDLVVLYHDQSHRVLRVSSQNIVMESYGFK